MDIRKRITNSKVYNTLLLLGGGIGIGLWIYNFIHYNDFFFNSYESLISSFIGLSCALAIKAFEIVLNKHVPWNKSVPFRLLIAVLTSILISLIVISLIMGIYLYFIGVLDDSFSMEQEVLLNLIALITFVSIIYNIINFAFHSYNTYSKGQVDKIKLERKRISLQLKALKDQLSPHFLFNSLNTISSLIYKDDEVAEQFIRNLAEAYKYTLKSYDKRLVSLKDELHFVKAYQDLLVTRFQDALQVTIDVESHLLETAIPPLTIQLLVENATKHNIINADMPLHLEVSNENKYLVISNNKTKCPENVRSFKIGLKNIDRRYELLTGQNIQVINATSDFCVKLPIIQNA